VFTWDPNMNSDVYDLSLSGTTLFAGGAFNVVSGLSEVGLTALLSVPGTVDAPLGPFERAEGRLSLSCAPNPVRTRTSFRFALPAAGVATLEVFDPAGRRVATLVDHEQLAAGPHEARFTPGALMPGTYFARLRLGAGTASRKLVVVE
jgi:hypothetical protein